MNMTYATQADFNRAPLGHPFMECCSKCGQPTGSILIKKQATPGTAKSASTSIPKGIIPSEDTICQFCHALGAYFAHEGIDPKETGLQYGMAKIVTQDAKTGVREDVAMVPFDNGPDGREIEIHPVDGESFKVEAKHTMVIQIDKAEDGGKLIAVLEKGV